MNIALDFDDTITLDRYFWGQFINLAKSCGHEIVIVTSRHPLPTVENRDITMYAVGWEVEIIYTSGEPKAQYYKADVWIDDYPASIPPYSQLHMESI